VEVEDSRYILPILNLRKHTGSNQMSITRELIAERLRLHDDVYYSAEAISIFYRETLLEVLKHLESLRAESLVITKNIAGNLMYKWKAPRDWLTTPYEQ